MLYTIVCTVNTVHLDAHSADLGMYCVDAQDSMIQQQVKCMHKQVVVKASEVVCNWFKQEYIIYYVLLVKVISYFVKGHQPNHFLSRVRMSSIGIVWIFWGSS